MLKMNYKKVIAAIFINVSLTFDGLAANNQQALQTGEIRGSIENLIAGYGSSWKSAYLFIETPFSDKFKTIADVQSKGFSKGKNSTVYSLDKDQEELFLAVPYTKVDKMYDPKKFKKLQPVEQGIFLSLNAIADTRKGIINSQDVKLNFDTSDGEAIQDYNINSLLGPLSYKNAQESEAAKKFVGYASMLNAPLDKPAAQNPAKLTEEEKDKLVLFNSIIAAQSAGIDNLYQMYLARKPVTGLAKKAGMNEAEGAVSPLKVEEYAASRRLDPTPKKVKIFQAGDNPEYPREHYLNWQQSIENSSPAMVTREIAYLLAEMRYELYQQRIAMERLIAVSSLSQIQQSRLLMYFLQTAGTFKELTNNIASSPNNNSNSNELAQKAREAANKALQSDTKK